MALGARRGEVRWMVLRDALRAVVPGVAVGLWGAVALAQALRAFWPGVSTRDPLTFVAVPCVLLLTSLLASWLPARRATRVDPMVALRGE